jgi:dephospho-CoA kinase
VLERRSTLEAEARARGDRVVISDIPLLFEAADPDGFDVVILVDAPPEIRRARLLASRGLSPEEADRMLAAQAPSGPKRARSTYVIDNDADRATLEARTRAVWNELVRLT